MARESINRDYAIAMLNNRVAEEYVNRSIQEVRPSQSPSTLFNKKEEEIVSQNSPAFKKEQGR